MFSSENLTQVSVEDEIRNHRLTDISYDMISGGNEHEVRCKSLPFQHGHRVRGAAAPGWENDLHRLHRGRECTGCTMAQRSELDYLSYNDPLGYADLILNGDLEEYLGTVISVHGFGD